MKLHPETSRELLRSLHSDCHHQNKHCPAGSQAQEDPEYMRNILHSTFFVHLCRFQIFQGFHLLNLHLHTWQVLKLLLHHNMASNIQKIAEDFCNLFHYRHYKSAVQRFA